MWKQRLQSTFIGMVSGTFGGTCGIGGSVVSVPLLTSRLGNLTQHQAHGTSVFGALGTGLVGATTFYLYGGKSVDIPAAGVITLSAMLTVRFAAKRVKHLSSKTLMNSLGAFLLCTPLLVLSKPVIAAYKEKKGPANTVNLSTSTNETVTNSQTTDTVTTTPAPADNTHHKPSHKNISGRKSMIFLHEDNNSNDSTLSWKDAHKIDYFKTAYLASIGILTGVVSGLFGAGGGIMMIPMLSLVTDQQISLGTSMLASLGPTTVSAITHYRQHTAYKPAVPWLFIGSVCGVYVGSRFAITLDDSQQRMLFSIVMLILGARNIIAARRIPSLVVQKH
eukprot:TRINITY_DN6137_c0_g1_i1.p1 TRINITY_DN6137_c0_g1~~TRINITY_DN6137_c0_g1_i1.p1  ORF type:complete len:334 (+),score=42.14 TRINITY_DN6137_c0_g1_i1:155-1156(+)